MEPSEVGARAALARAMKSSGIAVLLALSGSLLDGSDRRLAAHGPTPDEITVSVVGTNDVHGYIFERNGRGGVTVLGGYIKNLRAARAADGGGVLLLDAGDTFQGGIDSNLSEGAVVIDAYNALGYTAAAIGNHEFEFGTVDPAVPGWTENADPRGALKAIAARANFPMLTANLLDSATGRLVDWPNVAPSRLVEIAGVKVGIVGVMTIEALRTTLASNVHGLDVAPLVPAIVAQATQLRDRGATVIVVTAHAGGRCTDFERPADLSSCDAGSEIFQVAKSLPHGLVDVIVAGHSHAGLAHEVEGIAIIESFALGQSFGRADLHIDRTTKRPSHVRLFPPHDLCTEENPRTGTCDPADRSAERVPVRYEGQIVEPDPAIVAAMAPMLQRVRDLKAIPLNVSADTPLVRAGDLESPLGNLFADALRESTPGADVGINNNAIGGLRADLPAGPLTWGDLYEVFPFDNRIATLRLTAAQLKQVFVEEIQRGRRGALGISGLRVRVSCLADGPSVELLRTSGEPIDDGERVVVVTTDMLATGSVFAVFASVAPHAGFDLDDSAPIVREAVTAWFRRRGGHLRASQFVDSERRRWEYADERSARCTVR